MHSLSTLVAAPGGYKHIRPAIAALAGDGNSLLASGRYERSNVLFVLEELTILAKAYLAQHGSKTGAVASVMSMLLVLMSQQAKSFCLVPCQTCCGARPTSKLDMITALFAVLQDSW